jgi:hypothetical protein
VAETSSPRSAALDLDRVVGVGMDALSARRAVEDGAALYLSFATYLVEYNNRKAARSLQHQTLSRVPSVRVEFLCVCIESLISTEL